MKGSRGYRAVCVKRVEVGRLISGRPRGRVHVGCDVGKEEVLTVIRWQEDDFERPWRAVNPGEIGRLVGLLEELAGHGEVVVAMEPTGTYGDPLRQALEDAGLVTHRVSPKAAYDYAEIFDGVPSQHDGKDAAVVTACVLWVHPGDPHDYHCAAAYRKAMGLNLKERSSGKWRGRLKISKRGSGQVRRWLFYAVLRLVQKPPVGRWYRRKKARDQDQAGRALIGVMRKTALA